MTDSSPATNVLQQFVERARALYSLPRVAAQVLELTSQPQVDTRAIKECLENDPALVAKILRVVNSSLFGLSRPVSDLNQALALLGTQPLKMLVLGFSLPRELWSGLEAEVLARYWRRSLVKAVAAREISERVWISPGDEAFIAGLLQDVGMLALIQDLGDPYARFLDRVRSEGGDLAALEAASLGFTHERLSARLFAHWGLPESLVRAVDLPRDVTRQIGEPVDRHNLPQILHLAELVAAMVVDTRPGALSELMEAGGNYRDLQMEQVRAILDTLEEKVAQLADVLSLELPAGVNCLEMLIEAQAQLASSAEEAAARIAREDRAAEDLLREARALKHTLALAAHRAPQTSAAVGEEKGVAVHKTNTSQGPSRPSRAAVDTLQLPAYGELLTSADPGLAGRVAAGVATCRAARQPMSLLLMGLDRYEDLLLTLGLGGAERLGGMVELALRAVCDAADVRLPLGDGCYGVLLERRDRPRAAQVARDAMHGFAERTLRCSLPTSATLSAGLATLAIPPKNFAPQELIDAAQRCLSAAQRSGGDSLKSIDL